MALCASSCARFNLRTRLRTRLELEKHGVVVVKLLSQESAAGRDDRQLIFLPPGTTPPALSPAGPSTFPNVPYEEAKGGA